MGRRPFIVWVIIFAAWVPAAQAYVQTLTAGGAPVHWPAGFKFNLAGNPVNSSGLSDDDFFTSVVHGLERWDTASQGAVKFDYWQGHDPTVYEPNSNYNGLSSVYFASNADAPTGLTPNILGLTQVWYNTSNGEILEADTVLNDHNFVFTENPEDTSGFGSDFHSHTRNRVFVENVLTHEFGHSLGLSHSATLQATMLYMESPEQAHLGCDEQTGIHAIYPSGDGGSRATITGSVIAPGGAPIFGASVLAISRRRGVVLGGAMTDPGGNYSIGGLEPGTYFLMAEPYFAGPQPLPAYYSKMNTSVCPQRDSFGRTVLVDSTGYVARPIAAPAGGAVSAPVIRVGCDSGQAAITGPSSTESQSTAPIIFDGSSDGLGGTGFGVTDRFALGKTHYFRLSNLSGHLEIRVLSYSLYSPIRLDLALVDSKGQSVPARFQSPVYQGDSGYANFDSTLVADGLTEGDYYLEASPSRLDPELYPAGQISLDSAPFAVITGTMNAQEPVMDSVLPFNARCRMDENFSPYQSPPGPPPRASPQKSDNSGGCSILQSNDSGNDRGGGGPMSPGAVGWLLPWALMMVIARLARRAARG